LQFLSLFLKAFKYNILDTVRNLWLLRNNCSHGSIDWIFKCIKLIRFPVSSNGKIHNSAFDGKIASWELFCINLTIKNYFSWGWGVTQW
jgi:hypothetical protein